MRKLLGLAVLFVVLSVCMPSYGYFLIYNVSTTLKGVDSATDLKVTVPLKGYLVLNLDTEGSFVDANLILYGKDSDKVKVYVTLNANDESDDRLGFDTWNIGDYVFVDFWGRSPWDFEIMLSGKTTLKDIGFGTSDKKSVASSIKGVNMTWDGFLLGSNLSQNVSGTANASATLWNVATKYVNDHEWTQDQIIVSGDSDNDGLITILEGKGYVAATLPPD